MSLGGNENSELFKNYLNDLSKKDRVNPNIEIATINAIASNFAVKNESERIDNCDLFAYLDAVKIKPKLSERRIWQDACEQARKEIENAPECPPLELSFGDWLEKQFKSFKNKVKSIAEKIKDAVGKLGTVAKKAYHKSLALAQDFVAITSRVANATSQVVFDQRLDWDETKEHSGVSDWFNNTTNELSELGETFLENGSEGVIKLTKATVNLGEATINFVEGDKASAKRALRRGKDNAHNGVRNVGKAGEAAYKGYYIAVAEAPLKLTAGGVDSLTGSELEAKYDEIQAKVSDELRKGSKQVGDVLEVTIQPENLGKIAFVYAASTIAGPLGSSMANVLYDKLVLDADLKGDDMFKSIAIGAAAGYAGEAAGGAFDSAYLSRAANSFASNTLSDGAKALLSDEEITAKGLLQNLGKAALSVKTGDGVANGVLDSAVQGIIDNTVEQTVDNGFKLDKIDFEQVKNSAIHGFANGITREAVHAMMDATLIKAIPQEWRRVDKKAFAEMKEAMYQALISARSFYQNELKQLIYGLTPEQKSRVFQVTGEMISDSQSEASSRVFGKKFEELTDKERKNPEFIRKMYDLIKQKSDSLQSDPELKKFATLLIANINTPNSQTANLLTKGHFGAAGGPISSPGLDISKIGDKFIKFITFGSIASTVGDTVPINFDNREKRKKASQKIGKGHAWEEHKDQFPDIETPEELGELAEDIMEYPDDVKELENGRTGFWDEKTKSLVIHDPNHDDEGTIFKPDDGKKYFDNLK